MFKLLPRKYPHPLFQYFIACWIIGQCLWSYNKENQILWLYVAIPFALLVVSFFCYLEGGNDEARRRDK